MPIRGFPTQGIVACFNEPDTGGSIEDFNASRNAPARDPGSYISYVQWHINFFQYELAYPVQTVNINHPGIAGSQKYWGPADQFWMGSPTYTSSISYRVPGQTLSTDHALFYHNLGYVPLAFVAYNGNMLMPGVAVQIESDGRSRFVSPYINTSFVGLREVYNSSIDGMGGVTRTYQIMVFKVPAAEAQRALFGNEGANVILGRGKIDTSKQYLRRVGSGDTPFDIDRGPTVDINSGRTRIVSGGDYITESGYGGSFNGSPYVAVGV